LKKGGEFYHYSTSQISGQALLEKNVTTPCPLLEKRRGVLPLLNLPMFGTGTT